MLVQTENTKILCLKYSLLPSYLWEALLSARAYLVAAAVASLITGSATAFAEGEDGGPPVTAFPDGFAPQGLDLFSEGHGFGDKWTTLNLWASRGKLTSLGRGEKFISSPDVATPPGDQDGARPDYDLNADYSSSTLDDSRFPATVTDFGSVDSLIQGGWMLFGDDDHADGFNFVASGSGTSGLSNFDPFSKDRSSRRGSSHCSSDGTSVSVVRCTTAEDLGSFVTNSADGQDGANQPGQQGSNPAGPSAPTGAGSLSFQQLLEMIVAQNMAWQWDAIQGTFPPCSASSACDGIPPVVGASALTSDFVSPNGNPDPPSDPPTMDLLENGGGPQQQTAVPEIPSWAMLLIGFGGLALLARRRLCRLARPGYQPDQPKDNVA